MSVVFFLLSWLGTGWYRQYALSRHILDIPNARSAHQKPIPRGGGVVFVGLILCAIFYATPNQLPLALLALGIALVGYFDDKRSMSALTRLGFHGLFSLGALIVLGGMPDVWIGKWLFHFGFWTSALGIIYLVWMLNLYNFMDGINGVAGFEAICAAMGIVVLYGFVGAPSSLMMVPLILAAVMAGFLIWNFPKATIFMGDVGSSFLGFLFGLWSLQAAYVHVSWLWSWLILLGVFIVDTTVTLLWRMIQGEKIHLAHSSHAYQHASRYYQSHVVVTLVIVAINIFWLWPWSVLVGLDYIDGLWGLMGAYFPLVMLAIYFKAGRSFT